MKIKILGSGGCQTTPRPCCKCEMCTKARKKGIPYSRAGCAIIVNDILIDAPLDLSNLLNRENIQDVSCVVYTHHHPDHILGTYVLEQAYWDWIENKPEKRKITVWFPPGVKKKIRKIIDEIEYLEKMGLIISKEIPEKCAKINQLLFEPIVINKEWNIYGFVIKEKDKTLFYAPCDLLEIPKIK